jgi:hypothetical protein
MTQQDFEKLGVFYLGRPYDPGARAAQDGFVLYDSKDLVTHAVCVGMTGSGKTGLCIGLLEEAAIDGIPAIVIDPKGDLANLLLAFPSLSPAEFLPWVNPQDAQQSGLSLEAFAAREAEKWKSGLARDGQDGERVRRLVESAEFRVFTPGSQAGLPVSILRSFAAPPDALVQDEELFQERVATSATSLLGLLSIDADPLSSREFVLISALLSEAWKAGRDLDLAELIREIQSPPMSRVGVIELESFYPAKERFQLALRLNNLLASPSFAAWLAGDPLDVQSALYTKEGKPRISIFSIAHLSEAERMFFVSLLLGETLAWARSQPGTQSLRAILYMDEIAGYFPPVREPPSKRPLLTLLKQARAHGLGVVLATQNPVDLDYKGLANAGTWFIGRLQTDQDKARVLDGLEAASTTGIDRATFDRWISGLEKRVFLLHNVHESEPVLFKTRFTLSYLRGPLARAEIQRLMSAKRSDVADPMAASGGAATPATAPVSTRPVLEPGVPELFVESRGGEAVTYSPALLGIARITFTDAKLGIAADRTVARRIELAAGTNSIDWENAAEIEVSESDLSDAPPPGARFTSLPPIAGQKKSYDAWKKSFADHVARRVTLELWKHTGTKLVSRPGESEGEFRTRLAHALRESRDEQAEKLRRQYGPKLAALEERVRRARAAVEREREQASQSKLQTALSFGATLLSAFTGRKKLSAGTIGRATTAARGVGRSMKEGQDIARAQESEREVEERARELEQEFRAELTELEAKLDPAHEPLEHLRIPPKRGSIEVRLVALAWHPSER